MAIKIIAADTWFSKCIRAANDWRCARCNTPHSESSTGLHCAHYMTRGKWATRFDPLNVAPLCYGCHSHLDANPHFKTGWFEGYLGEDVAAIIREKSETTKHNMKKFKREIAAHYRAELARIKAERLAGAVGKIQVIGFL